MKSIYISSLSLFFSLSLSAQNVGIGTATPVQKLHVYQNIDASKCVVFGEAKQQSASTNYDNIGVGGLGSGSLGNGTGNAVGVMGIADVDNAYLGIGVFAGLGATMFPFPASSLFSTALYADANGNGNAAVFMNGFVGLGTETPAYELDVQGHGAFSSLSGTGVRPVFADTDGHLVAGGGIADWWEVGTSNLPDDINDDMYHLGGNVGIGIATPTHKLHVEADVDNAPVILGKNTNMSAGTTSFGVRGESVAGTVGSAAVYGYSIGGGANEIGVLGDYTSWGAAVMGMGWGSVPTDMPSFRDMGVLGLSKSSTGVGVYAKDDANMAGSYSFYGAGKFAVTGSKSASVPTSQGNQLLYCTESPELWFEDFGEVQVVDGKAEVSFDPLFLETVFIDQAHPFHVFLQEYGSSKGLYAVKKTDGTGFYIEEKDGGKSTLSVSFRIVAKRRFYQDHRFGIDVQQALENNLEKAQYVQPIPTSIEAGKKIQARAQAEK